jgi:Helix-hairpin-helix containing domain
MGGVRARVWRPVPLHQLHLRGELWTNCIGTKGGEMNLPKLLSMTGFSARRAGNIIQTLGSRAAEIVAKNPYNLLAVKGFGFRSADKIAARLGFDMNSVQRLIYACSYALREASASGHVCLPEQLLQARVVSETDCSPHMAAQAVEQAVAEGKIVRDAGDGGWCNAPRSFPAIFSRYFPADFAGSPPGCVVHPARPSMGVG